MKMQEINDALRTGNLLSPDFDRDTQIDWPQQDGEVDATYQMVAGRHSKIYLGIRRHILPGDTLHPTQKELDAFPDKFKLVAGMPPKADEPEEKADEPSITEEPAENKGDDFVIDRQDFSSESAYNLWVDNGSFDLIGVSRTGHGGRTFSKKDVQGALK